MTSKRFLTSISMWFIFAVLTACGGGGGAGGSSAPAPATPTPSPTPVPTATVPTVPGAPTIDFVVAGNSQATVGFFAPASNGGAAITSYTVTSNPGGLTASGLASGLTVTGLTNGVAYTFTVRATNSVGTGAASAPSSSVTPVGPPIGTLPSAPVIGSATAGNAQATVTFTAPASSGNTPITGYFVTSSPGGLIALGIASPVIVTGLTNGVAYTFTVTASNTTGSSPASAPTNSITPIGPPGAPVMGSATAGNAQATVTFTAPSSNGGAAISGYTVTSSPGGLTASGLFSPLTVTGLSNGTAYIFTVTATNSQGTGPVSAASNSVTPVGAPSVSVTATSPKLLTFNWSGIPGATHYKLLKNPNGVSGYTQIGTDLPGATTTATDYIGVHVHDWVNASYIVQACNAGGCTSSSAVLTASAMIAAIGYFKASNTGSSDFFGYSVSLSADGTMLAVGANQENSSTTGINSTSDEAANDAGAVYVYSRSGNLWSHQAYIKASNTGASDFFGSSVSLSGDGTALAVGAYGEDSSTAGINSTPDEGAADAGAVYVYSRSGSSWSQQAYIKASNTGASDFFGYSVSLSGDGTTLVAGAYQEDSSSIGINSTPNESANNAGAVYIYTSNGSTWSQQAYIKATNTEAVDLFGYSVSLATDGETLAVGAHGESSSTTGINSTPDNAAIAAGAVYIYSRSGITWSQQAYIKASNTDADDRFGISVALSGEGASLAVGAYQEKSTTTGINSTPNNDASQAGAVYIYSRSGITWSQEAYIKASNTGDVDRFGTSVSLSVDGMTLAVGAELEDSSMTGINSTPNEAANNAGAVYIYTSNGSTWSQQAYIKASNTGANDRFGISVSLTSDGKTLAAGAFREASSTIGINSIPDESAPGAGAVYLY